jgi:hypothetical protein
MDEEGERPHRQSQIQINWLPTFLYTREEKLVLFSIHEREKELEKLHPKQESTNVKNVEPRLVVLFF